MAEKKRSIASKRALADNLGENILWTALIGIAGALVLVFGLSMKNIFDESSLRSSLQDHSEYVADQIEEDLDAIQSKAIEQIQLHGSKENAETLIKEALPEAIRVMVINEPVSAIIPDPNFPSVNFATLDMLKRISEQQQDLLPEIHLYGQQNQYINYVYLLESKQKYLIISYPADIIFRNIDKLSITEGNIALVQKSGKWSSVTLKSWGLTQKDNSYFPEKDVNISNSHFYISYSYQKPFTLIGHLGTLPITIIFISSLLLFFASLGKRQQRIQAIIKKAEAEDSSAQKYYIPKKEKIEDGETKQLTDENTTTKAKVPEQSQVALPDATIFKAYDIRGIVDKTLTQDAVFQIGQAIGTENKRRGGSKIVVARDGRLSGPTLLEMLIKGLMASGTEVINIGAVPTGVLYYATHHLNTGSGVMLTGSHNPPDYNGLKIVLNGETLAGDTIQNLYQLIKDKDLESGTGSVQEIDIADDYIDQISSDIQLEKPLKVVVDCGNGIAGNIAPEVLEEIGCEVIPLHCEVDGNFPNHHPDPSVPENLQDLIATLQSLDADIGVAFDGDGDRLGVVTKSGEIIYPDRLLMLFAKDVLTRVPGSSIIFDVKCTGHLPKYIVKSGGMPIMWKTGHSFMKAKLKETDAALAGEMSGHFFFNERWYGFDDGIYSAARLLEIIDQEDRSAQEIFDELPKGVSTPELKAEMEEGEHYKFMQEFKNKCEFPDAKITTIDGIRADFSDGWGLVRCSNTTPCLVIRFDADSEAALERIQNEFKTQILAVNDSINLPF